MLGEIKHLNVFQSGCGLQYICILSDTVYFDFFFSEKKKHHKSVIGLFHDKCKMYYKCILSIWDQTSHMVRKKCSPGISRDDSDQPVHPSSLI